MDTKALVNAQLDKLLAHKWVRVGHHTVKLVEFRPDPEADHVRGGVLFGYYVNTSLSLGIARNLSSLNHLGYIFLHELGHAVWDALDIHGAEDQSEETYVDRTTAGIWQVFRDNPWVLPWISECLRYDHMIDQMMPLRDNKGDAL